MLEKEVDKHLEEEDIRWKQRVKQKWLRKGDRNTKFFHQCANQRRKTNTIKSIKDKCGNDVASQEGIAAQFQAISRIFFLHLILQV